MLFKELSLKLTVIKLNRFGILEGSGDIQGRTWKTTLRDLRVFQLFQMKLSVMKNRSSSKHHLGFKVLSWMSKTF